MCFMNVQWLLCEQFWLDIACGLNFISENKLAFTLPLVNTVGHFCFGSAQLFSTAHLSVPLCNSPQVLGLAYPTLFVFIILVIFSFIFIK